MDTETRSESTPSFRKSPRNMRGILWPYSRRKLHTLKPTRHRRCRAISSRGTHRFRAAPHRGLERISRLLTAVVTVSPGDAAKHTCGVRRCCEV